MERRKTEGKTNLSYRVREEVELGEGGGEDFRPTEGRETRQLNRIKGAELGRITCGMSLSKKNGGLWGVREPTLESICTTHSHFRGGEDPAEVSVVMLH